MKILYYSGHPNLNLKDKTGYGTHMREVIQGFKNHGHEVNTFIAGGSHDNITNNTFKKHKFKEIIKKIIPAILWESIKDYKLLKKDLENEIKLNEIISQYSPDLIYERGYYLLKSGSNVATKNNIKHYIEFNAPYVEERVTFSGKSFYLNKAKIIELEVLINADAIIVVTSTLKSYFSKLESNISSKILVTPNAISPNSIKINLNNKKKLFDELKLENNFIFGFVGSIFPYHGVDLLIEAFSKVNLNNKNSKLLIIGNGNTIPELKKLASKLNIDEQVIFTGQVPHEEVFDYISLMDVTVSAKAAWYNSPVKIFEYGYMGKAIIAPNYEAIKDILIDKENSLLVAPNNKELANAMLLLIKDKELKKKISKNIKTQIINKHTWDKVVKSILDFKV